MAQTVINGSGIIGLSTAYHLSKHQPGPTIHLVDSSAELFASASGFAGGFLVKGWFESASAPLGRLSFEEHARLAEEAGGAEKWGYAKSVTVASIAQPLPRLPVKVPLVPATWMPPERASPATLPV